MVFAVGIHLVGGQVDSCVESLVVLLVWFCRVCVAGAVKDGSFTEESIHLSGSLMTLNLSGSWMTCSRIWKSNDPVHLYMHTVGSLTTPSTYLVVGRPRPCIFGSQRTPFT